jgi:glycosyltransferase involved in cell wall biosynthesis
VSNTPPPVLYISYDGMTDPLGQSQVLPYLIRLQKSHPVITVLSAEKPERYQQEHTQISALMEKHQLRWEPIIYHKSPPLLSTIYDLIRLKQRAKKHCAKKHTIVHCRSYIAALVGLHMKRKHRAGMVFDMRGFWADERIEGGIWPQQHWLYSKVYRYFKRKELAFFQQADATISLTYRGKKEIESRFQIPSAKIKVVPCCVDAHDFNPETIKEEEQKKAKNQLGISDTDFLVGYLGSIGSWYLLEEMLDFFVQLKKKNGHARFLFITKDKASSILKKATARGLSTTDLIITAANRADVPLYLSLCKLGLFFILPVFSKLASSPTKMGEMLSMGLSVICNNEVGDVEEIVAQGHCGIIVKEFNNMAYRAAIDNIDTLLAQPPTIARKAAETYFNIETGVDQYLEAYKACYS